ncbi:MAG: threonine ammonia-lyase [Dehalococcoidia bacterium]
MAGLVTLHDIEAARERIRERVRATPVWPSRALSERLGIPLSLKCENLQRTGSFKPRGALNMIASAPRPAGVVAGSAGNHAQGVALAASMLGLPARVFMPAEAPIAKRLATEGYGATVELVEGPLAAAIEGARQFAAERGHLFVPPFDHPDVVAGQGTVGLEILEQEPDVNTVLVPAGGGGLLAGVALAVKSVRPEVRVIGVQARAMPGIVESKRLGRRGSVPAVRTIADGVGVAGPSELTFALIEQYVDDVVDVAEDAIARAVVTLIERTKLVVEGAGALGVAALLAGAAVAQGRTVCVLSGGNIDINLLDRIVERGLLDEGRRQRLTFAAANVPGELARITSALAAGGANIIEVEHELVVPGLPIGVARVTVRLDVAGPEGLTRLEVALLEAGLRRGIETDFATVAAAEMPA